VVIGDSVTTIGEDAFKECSSLESVVIPDGVKTIGRFAFGKCIKLMSVTIGGSVTEIREGKFSDCRNLAKATFLGDAPSLQEEAFGGVPSYFAVYYLSSRSGFESPVWEGYPAIAIDEPDNRVADAADRLGEAVAVNGRLMAVGNSGEQAVKVYALVTGKVLPDLEPRDGAGEGFGRSVSLSETHAVVGAPSETGGGAYLFDLSTGEEVHQWRPEH
jgi:hypothetical protein